jgi:hypothetical protein
MTFGAMAAWQAWLLLAGAAALATALFLIKLRPPRLIIPSVLIWTRVLDDLRQQTLWERIRRAVSLIATVIIALALALAVVRPGRVADGGTRAAGRLLVVLDASWSMEAATQRGKPAGSARSRRRAGCLRPPPARRWRSRRPRMAWSKARRRIWR